MTFPQLNFSIDILQEKLPVSLLASSMQASFFEKGHFNSPIPNENSSKGSNSKKSGLAPSHGKSILTRNPHVEQTLTSSPQFRFVLKYLMTAFFFLSLPH